MDRNNPLEDTNRTDFAWNKCLCLSKTCSQSQVQQRPKRTEQHDTHSSFVKCGCLWTPFVDTSYCDPKISSDISVCKKMLPLLLVLLVATSSATVWPLPSTFSFGSDVPLCTPFKFTQTGNPSSILTAAFTRYNALIFGTAYSKPLTSACM